MSQDIENIKVDSVSSIQVEEELIIEDEPVPGGAAVAGGEVAFYIGVVMVIAISIGVISKKSK